MWENNPITYFEVFSVSGPRRVRGLWWRVLCIQVIWVWVDLSLDINSHHKPRINEGSRTGKYIVYIYTHRERFVCRILEYECLQVKTQSVMGTLTRETALNKKTFSLAVTETKFQCTLSTSCQWIQAVVLENGSTAWCIRKIMQKTWSWHEEKGSEETFYTEGVNLATASIIPAETFSWLHLVHVDSSDSGPSTPLPLQWLWYFLYWGQVRK